MQRGVAYGVMAGALWGGFANAGQTCSGIERVYVLRAVSDRFIAGVVAGAQGLAVGDPLGWETEIGPMVSREQFELVRELVDDAVAAGAQLRCGGPVEVPGFEPGAFFAPAVLTGEKNPKLSPSGLVGVGGFVPTGTKEIFRPE